MENQFSFHSSIESHRDRPLQRMKPSHTPAQLSNQTLAPTTNSDVKHMGENLFLGIKR